jgi:orotidine-5'-phosphate decarboxylase
MTTFAEKLRQAQIRNQSWLCVGLDPVRERLPEAVFGPDPADVGAALLTFGRAIVEATADLVCAYKPNLGFWLAEGPAGLRALQALIADVPDDLPVIRDAKFNDVGHTAAAYARAAFDILGADAVTTNPYLGRDGLRPFVERAERGAFILARTSNPSAPDLQDRAVEDRPLYEEVARLARRWDAEYPGTCGLVVGATYPEEMSRLRALTPGLPFLIPGVGAQGGNLEAAVTHGPSTGPAAAPPQSPPQSRGEVGCGPVINSSRGIIYASSGPDFAQAARAAAQALRDRINQSEKSEK